MSEVDKLHDALERWREVMAGLRNELHAKDKRIADLEAENTEKTFALKVADGMLVQYLEDVQRQAVRIAELEAAQDGRTYAEGCTP